MEQEKIIKACLKFLQKYVKPFKPQFIKKDILNVLIRQSRMCHTLDEGDSYANNLDIIEDAIAEDRHRMITDE